MLDCSARLTDQLPAHTESAGYATLFFSCYSDEKRKLRWDCSVLEVQLEPGDVVSIHTDRITERVGKNGDEFGEARLLSALRESLSLDAESIVQKVEQVVQEFRLGEQHDDVTIVVACSR